MLIVKVSDRLFQREPIDDFFVFDISLLTASSEFIKLTNVILVQAVVCMEGTMSQGPKPHLYVTMSHNRTQTVGHGKAQFSGDGEVKMPIDLVVGLNQSYSIIQSAQMGFTPGHAIRFDYDRNGAIDASGECHVGLTVIHTM